MMPWSVQNGILIDIIGTFNGGTATLDETIRRKATVTAPSTTFNKATQWDVFALDTCNNLEVVATKEPKLFLMVLLMPLLFIQIHPMELLLIIRTKCILSKSTDNLGENFQCRKYYQI
jgi:hypothetical protein